MLVSLSDSVSPTPLFGAQINWCQILKHRLSLPTASKSEPADQLECDFAHYLAEWYFVAHIPSVLFFGTDATAAMHIMFCVVLVPG